MMKPITRSFALCVCALALACGGGAPSGPRAALNPAHDKVPLEPLLPSEQLKPAMFLQQRLSGTYGGRALSISCVLQLSEGTLTVIGLTPFGSRAFVLTERGTQVTLEKFVDHEVPFAPERVVEDIQRVLFRRVFAHDFIAKDGVHELVIGGEKVRELWARGAVVKRTFLPVGGGSENVVVEFHGQATPLVAPHVELRNLRYGYSLAIDTVVQRILPR